MRCSRTIRAGTFIYHTHWHDFLQLTGRLYGPLIVLRPGQTFDPETDKAVMIGLGAAHDTKSPLLPNGSAQPEPLRLKTGVKYRLRFINITPNNAGSSSPCLLALLQCAGAPWPKMALTFRPRRSLSERRGS